VNKAKLRLNAVADIELAQNLSVNFLIGSVLLFLVFIINYTLNPAIDWVVAAPGISAILCFAAFLATRHFEIPGKFANPLLSAGLLLFLGNTAIRVIFLNDFGLGSLFFFAASGMLFNRISWLLAMTTIGLIVVFLINPSDSNTTATVMGPHLMATVVAFIFFFVRKTTRNQRISTDLQLVTRQTDAERLVAQLRRAVEQRDNAIERLKLAGTNYEEIIYRSPVPMCIHNEGEILNANGPMCDLLEGTESELKHCGIIGFISGINTNWISNTSGLPTQIIVTSRAGTIETVTASNIDITTSSAPAHLLVFKEPQGAEVTNHVDTLHTPQSRLSETQPHAIESTEHKLKIVVAEDNAVNMQIICAMIEHLNHQIVGRAVNGTQVITDLVELKPDVLLLDLYMPELDGYEVCKLLRADPRMIGLRIVAVSAHADADSIKPAIDTSMDDYVTKPIAIDQLAKSLRG
jgi:CheY-like chemotaxis protein